MPNQSQKLSQLAAISSVETTDMVYVVSAGGGTLTGYRATVSQLTAALGGMALGGTIGGSPTTGDILVVGAGGVLAQAATIPGSQVSGDIAGNAAGITGTIAESQVVGLVADLAAAHDLSFTFRQSTPSASWTIVHNLGKRPSVTVVDSADSVVIGRVSYLDLNTVRIDFSGAFSGSAYLN